MNRLSAIQLTPISRVSPSHVHSTLPAESCDRRYNVFGGGLLRKDRKRRPISLHLSDMAFGLGCWRRLTCIACRLVLTPLEIRYRRFEEKTQRNTDDTWAGHCDCDRPSHVDG